MLLIFLVTSILLVKGGCDIERDEQYSNTKRVQWCLETISFQNMEQGYFLGLKYIIKLLLLKFIIAYQSCLWITI